MGADRDSHSPADAKAAPAGVGARLLVGDIPPHLGFGYTQFAAVFTELKLAPDASMAQSLCPHESYVSVCGARNVEAAAAAP